MPKVWKTAPKNVNELTAQWDSLAVERDRQLRSGVDVSFNHVVAPTAMRLLEAANRSTVLDVGSGTGHFAAIASDHADMVIGIEPSAVSVSIARTVCIDRKNVEFFQTTVEDFAAAPGQRPPTAAVALMVMMAAPDLALFARSVSALLPHKGAFVAVIPHPCFWPTYWGYADKPWFSYTKETFIEAPFTISGSETNVLTTHIHRPLDQYFSALADAGFHLDTFEEPMPNPDVESMYPTRWAFPRFVAARWIKN